MFRLLTGFPEALNLLGGLGGTAYIIEVTKVVWVGSNLSTYGVRSGRGSISWGSWHSDAPRLTFRGTLTHSRIRFTLPCIGEQHDDRKNL